MIALHHVSKPHGETFNCQNEKFAKTWQLLRDQTGPAIGLVHLWLLNHLS